MNVLKLMLTCTIIIYKKFVFDYNHIFQTQTFLTKPHYCCDCFSSGLFVRIIYIYHVLMFFNFNIKIKQI